MRDKRFCVLTLMAITSPINNVKSVPGFNGIIRGFHGRSGGCEVNDDFRQSKSFSVSLKHEIYDQIGTWEEDFVCTYSYGHPHSNQ